MIQDSLYVDDITILAKTITLILEIKTMLNNRFDMHDLGELTHIIKWHVVRHRPSRTAFIHQGQYTSAILQRFGLENCASVQTPVEANKRLQRDIDPKHSGDVLLNTADHHQYRAIVGSLMYLMTGTRPDLAHLLQLISQFLQAPTRAHMAAAKHGLRYLSGTLQ